MKIHKVGHKIILFSFLILGGLDLAFSYLIPWLWLTSLLIFSSVIFFFLIIYFFRVPKRNIIINENHIMAPSDGKIVVIEEVDEKEMLHEKCQQISIFMSPLNVHCQWYPINGLVKYFNG